jgi:GxxExxY protein
MVQNPIGEAIIGTAMRVHSVVGPGLLESAYEACLFYELEKRGFDVRKQVLLPVRYDGLIVDAGYRIDLLVESSVILSSKRSRPYCRCAARSF